MGAPDAQGVYIYTEDDLAAPDDPGIPGGGFSEMLNKAPRSISEQLEEIRALIDEVDGGVSTRRFVIPFSHTGTLTVKAGRPLKNRSGRTLVIDVIATNLGTASSSGSVQADVEIEGISILSGPITYAASAAGDVDTTPTTTDWADGDDLTIDVDSAGTGAADLTIGVWVH